MRCVEISPMSCLKGKISVPGDKSISHRAAMLGALGMGTTQVQGFLMAEDCLNTISILEDLGIEIERQAPGRFIFHGKGLYGLKEPGDILYAGNSGTTMRL